MISVYIPKIEDLWFKELMLSDPDTMSYNHAWGGCIPFPKEEWQEWHDYWIINHENKRFYRYLKNEEDKFVGEIAYHYNEKEKKYLLDVIIYSKYRHQGYGSEGVKLLCAIARENGIEEVYDDIAIDNPAISLFIKQGFFEEYRTDELIYLKKNL